MANTKGTKVTPEEFKEIKLLTEANVSTGQIQRLKQRSYGVVRAVDETENFEEYIEYVRKQYEKYHDSKDEKDTDNGRGTKSGETIVKLLKKVSVGLDDINGSLREIGKAMRELNQHWE